MLNLGSKINKNLIVVAFFMLMQVSAIAAPSPYAAPTSFLPMEDALAAARSTPGFVNENIKPYRQSFNLGDKASHRGYFDFTTTDIFAFIFLAGVYLVFVRRNSQSRNASF